MVLNLPILRRLQTKDIFGESVFLFFISDQQSCLTNREDQVALGQTDQAKAAITPFLGIPGKVLPYHPYECSISLFLVETIHDSKKCPSPCKAAGQQGQIRSHTQERGCEGVIWIQ